METTDDYVNRIFTVLDQIKEEGFKHFRQEKSIITEDSEEVSLQNNTIRITLTENCIAITIRGRFQARWLPSFQKEHDLLKEDFDFFIKNEQKENGDTYEQFIERSLNTMSDHNPHLLCIYLEDYEGEFKEDDKIHMSLAYDSNDNDIYKKLNALANKNFTTIQRYLYQDYEHPNIFPGGIIIKKEIPQKSLEISTFRGREPLEIKNFKLYLECDKWYIRKDENGDVKEIIVSTTPA